MMKNLIAEKCADGWYVIVKIGYTVETESEVRDIARYEGLKINEELANKEKIYAR